jgi:PUA domain protein
MTLMIRKRHTIKKKKGRQLLKKIIDLFGSLEAKKFEVAEYDEMTIYILDDKIEFVEGKEGIHPVLTSSVIERIPSVIVDMGAVPYICNGADVMAPGISDINTPFEKKELVIIRDITHRKILAIGRAKMSSEEIKLHKKGKVISNIHYVGDNLWQIVS